jgi:hypothetical protein
MRDRSGLIFGAEWQRYAYLMFARRALTAGHIYSRIKKPYILSSMSCHRGQTLVILSHRFRILRRKKEGTPEDKDSSRSRAGDGETREDEEESFVDFFDAGEGAVIGTDSHYAQPPRAVKAAPAPKTRPSGPSRPALASPTEALHENRPQSTSRARSSCSLLTSKTRVGRPDADNRYAV